MSTVSWSDLGDASFQVVRNFTSSYQSGGCVKHFHEKLGQFASTAICCNDLLSSVLFTTGLTAIYAGYWAPLCLMLVSAVLVLFRQVYIEVVSALPINGATYTAMVNTSSKMAAAAAGSLSLLSYISAAVVAAISAMHYLALQWSAVPIVGGTLIVVTCTLFGLLTLLGLKESANASIVFCTVHVVTMTILMTCSIVYGANEGWSTLKLNYSAPGPTNTFLAIFYGFSSAMLGVTGFETSANFVEEQQPGVYAKTLRNMIVSAVCADGAKKIDNGGCGSLWFDHVSDALSSSVLCCIRGGL
jgi:amino acid transporter